MKGPEYQRRYEAALAQMKHVNIPVPSMMRLQQKISRRLGFQLLPPLYETFGMNALRFGTGFGVAWGLWMHFLTWGPNNRPILLELGASVLAGSLFGLSMASWCRHTARRKGLSRWTEL